MIESWISVAFLFVASFLASVASTSIGAGGSFLLVSMATILPMPIVIPVHACVTFIGNLNRWVLLREFVDRQVLLLFAVGTTIGIVLAAPLVGYISTDAWKSIIGIFLLISIWWKPKGLNMQGRHYPWQCGVVTSFLSVFVGATKPILVATFRQRFSNHKTLVATCNACATFPHVGKVILFAAFGGAFFQYWWLVTILVLASVIGAYIGKFLIVNVSGDTLGLVLKIFISMLGANLLISGLAIAPWS